MDNVDEKVPKDVPPAQPEPGRLTIRDTAELHRVREAIVNGRAGKTINGQN